MSALKDTAVLIGKANAASKITGTITVGANENRVLVVSASRRGTTAVNSVKVGGSAATKLVSKSLSATITVDLWGIVAPPTGAVEVVVEFAASVTDPMVFTFSAKGVSQAGGAGTFRNTATFAEANEKLKATITTVAGDLVVDCFGFTYGGEGEAKSLSEGQTKDLEEHTADFETLAGVSHKTATGASTVMEWVMSSFHSAALAAVALVPAAEEAAPTVIQKIFNGTAWKQAAAKVFK